MFADYAGGVSYGGSDKAVIPGRQAGANKSETLLGDFRSRGGPHFRGETICTQKDLATSRKGFTRVQASITYRSCSQYSSTVTANLSDFITPKRVRREAKRVALLRGRLPI